MSSEAFQTARAAFGELLALAEVPVGSRSTAAQRAWLCGVETLGRCLPALCHEPINALVEHATAEELGGSLRNVLADDLRITREEAGRRIAEATDLGPQQSLTAQPLPPKLEHTAAGQAAGAISAEHVQVIRAFFAKLPCCVDAPAREQAEHDLASIAAKYRPDQLRTFGKHLQEVLNPDGTFTDADRARRRGIRIGPQGPDGLSPFSGYLTPETRAGWDAVSAKLAAPGMCNPADEDPVIDGEPDEQTVRRDARSAAQRNHDAFAVIVRSALMSGDLGSHQGLPVTIVATATLQDLQAKTGVAHTATGATLPIKDVIRMSSHAYHFLLLFDKAKRCALYRGRTTRLATAAQRLVLTATEHGCTRPGCTVPAAWTQVHHLKDWAHGGSTDIDNLTLSCGPDNRLADQPGWITRKRKDGATEWIPPPHLDHGGPRTNTYWHPENMLDDDGNEDAGKKEEPG